MEGEVVEVGNYGDFIDFVSCTLDQVPGGSNVGAGHDNSRHEIFEVSRFSKLLFENMGSENGNEEG